MPVVFSVPDMSCGHCAAAIEKAVHRVDAAAAVQCDVPRKRVTVSGSAAPEAVMAALTAEGYPATPCG
jgi:copper chaperone